MAYRHTNSQAVTYYLNSKGVVLPGGRETTIYYFSKDERPETSTDLPQDRNVQENPRNGFLTLRRNQGASPDVDPAVERGTLSAELQDVGVGLLPEGVQLALFDPGKAGVFKAPDGEIYNIGPVFAATVRGIDRCIDRLNRLITQESAPEADFQRCLEECPELLRIFGYADAVPHVVLEAAGDKLNAAGDKIPDFILRPMTSDLCDILELKLPSMPLVKGSETRPRLAWQVTDAFKQLYEYAEMLDDPRVRTRVEERYQLRFFQPRLYLIAGRSIALDRVRLRRAMMPDFRTEIYTWDDVLVRARESLR